MESADSRVLVALPSRTEADALVTRRMLATARAISATPDGTRFMGKTSVRRASAALVSELILTS